MPLATDSEPFCGMVKAPLFISVWNLPSDAVMGRTLLSEKLSIGVSNFGSITHTPLLSSSASDTDTTLPSSSYSMVFSVARVKRLSEAVICIAAKLMFCLEYKLHCSVVLFPLGPVIVCSSNLHGIWLELAKISLRVCVVEEAENIISYHASPS